jgi:hypothetical protein
MKSFLFAAIVLIASSLPAQSIVTHIALPTPDAATNVNPELKGLVWHKWSTPNFTILSLDKDTGCYLYQNVERMKVWVICRWGFPDISFSAECRIFCVPDADTLEKLFGVKTSTAQVRRGSDGKIEISVLWLVVERATDKNVLGALTQVCLNELGVRPLWIYRGMGILNESIPRQNLRPRLSIFRKLMDSDQKMFFSKAILTMTANDWNKLPTQYKTLYDSEAAALCLMLRKEFGENALLEFMATAGTESDLKNCFGFNSYSQFDVTFKRYLYYVSVDIEQDRMPEEYLDISRKAK